jgi:hypothetical protein
MLEHTSRPLNVLENVCLSTEQTNRLRVIEEYDLWFVTERVAQKGTLAAERIPEAVIEFKKYVALLVLGHKSLGMHSYEVDEIWHNFIMFTREYGEFCQRTAGQMIHHRPNTSRRPQLPPTSVPTFEEVYRTFFGPPPSIWRSQRKTEFPAAYDDQSSATSSFVREECDTQGDEPKCDSEGDEPKGRILAGDCDVVEQPPCDSVLSSTCDGAGHEDCKAVLLNSDCDSDGHEDCKAVLLNNSPSSSVVSP